VADATHLEVAIGVEILPDANGDVYAFMNEVDPAIRCNHHQLEFRIAFQEGGKRVGEGAMQPDRAAHANEPPAALPAC